MPAISVIVPVYNGEEYILEAIQSIRDQEFDDFELIIINDGSTDASEEIIKSIKDKRILYFAQSNKGLPATLNRGIALAHGLYIARQDQDDISRKDRLKEQFRFLERHHEYALVGSWADIRNEKNHVLKHHRHFVRNDDIKFNLLFQNYFVHSSVMFRKSIVEKIGYYSVDTSRQPPEDYEYFSRISRRYKVYNIPKLLVSYRKHHHRMSVSFSNSIAKNGISISRENIISITGRENNTFHDVLLAPELFFHDYQTNLETSKFMKIAIQVHKLWKYLVQSEEYKKLSYFNVLFVSFIIFPVYMKHKYQSKIVICVKVLAKPIIELIKFYFRIRGAWSYKYGHE